MEQELDKVLKMMKEIEVSPPTSSKSRNGQLISNTEITSRMQAIIPVVSFILI
jgi:hypothetical protein